MCMAAAAMGASKKGGALRALFDAAGKKPTAAQTAETGEAIGEGQLPGVAIGGPARPITANTPGQVGTGLQIGR